jgi:hypothetical protein
MRIAAFELRSHECQFETFRAWSPFRAMSINGLRAIALNKQYGTEREDVLSSDRATSENGVALQKRAANLDVLRVKQAATRFALERRRGSTVPPAPPLLMFTPTVE